MKKVKEISHLIFLRLMKNGNTITPDMQLHIEDVLNEEVFQPLSDKGKAAEEIFDKYCTLIMQGYGGNYMVKDRMGFIKAIKKYASQSPSSVLPSDKERLKDAFDAGMEYDRMIHGNCIDGKSFNEWMRDQFKSPVKGDNHDYIIGEFEPNNY